MFIYMYTTDIYEQNQLFKIGQTTQQPEDRVKQQDTTSNPEELRLLCCWKVHNKSITDHMVHQYLESKGFERPRHNREWFKGGKHELTSAISQFLGDRGSSEIPAEAMSKYFGKNKHVPQKYAEQKYVDQREADESAYPLWLFLFFLAIFLNLLV